MHLAHVFIEPIMKTLFCSLLIVFSGFTSLQAQEKSTFVYVEIPALSEHRRDAELKNLFKDIEGISAISYCENLHLAILRTESNPEELKKSVSQRMHDLKFRYSIKSGASFKQVMQYCN